MAQATTGFSRYTPGLLLLGLLGLLLWHECGPGPSPPSYEVRSVQADSLAAPTAQLPARLYFTVSLHNNDFTSFRLQSMNAVLHFRNATWYWLYEESQNEEVLVPARSDLRLPMAITLHDSLGRAPAALSQLREALHGGTARDSTLLLYLTVTPYVTENSYYATDSYAFPLQAMPVARRRKVPRPY